MSAFRISAFQRFSFSLVLPSSFILSLGARHLASNNASARVLAKLGMVQEGLLREFARKGDAFHDVVMMALLREEWPPAQKLGQPDASVPAQKALS